MAMLDGQVAIVTGGGSGIGKAVVERFVAEGAKVCAVDRVADRVKELQERFSGSVIGVAADVSSYEDNRRTVEETVRAFGKLDAFIGNAGIWDFGASLMDTEPDKLSRAFDELISVNVKGGLLGAKAASQELTASRGSIIFTLSNAAFWPGGGGPIYTTSKHALVGLIRQLSYELWPNVRVNGVAPGGTVTDLRGLSALGQSDTSWGQMIAGMQASGAMGEFKMAEPADHAAAYVYLASREASQVHGTIIDSTSGMLSMMFKRAMGGLG